MTQKYKGVPKFWVRRDETDWETQTNCDVTSKVYTDGREEQKETQDAEFNKYCTT